MAFRLILVSSIWIIVSVSCVGSRHPNLQPVLYFKQALPGAVNLQPGDEHRPGEYRIDTVWMIYGHIPSGSKPAFDSIRMGRSTYLIRMSAYSGSDTVGPLRFREEYAVFSRRPGHEIWRGELYRQKGERFPATRDALLFMRGSKRPLVISATSFIELMPDTPM
jgi:hypothetical protein